MILHHLTGKNRMLEPWVDLLPNDMQSAIHGGYLAVSTFFVLSGFVLARSYAGTAWDRRKVIEYTAARYARVYPVYLVSLLVLAPIMYEYLSVPHRTGRMELLAHYGLVLQGWSGASTVQWNTPAWSLSCEMFFYACFPLLLIAIRKANWPLLALSALAAPALLEEAGLPGAWNATTSDQVVVRLLGEITNPQFLQFFEAEGRDLPNMSTRDFIFLDAVSRAIAVPDSVRSRADHLIDLGLIERVGHGRGVRYVLSRTLYAFTGKAGVYTRHRGLDRRTNKALLVEHIRGSGERGTALSELTQVLPALSQSQVKNLLQELKAESAIENHGKRRHARWFLVGNRQITIAKALESDEKANG